MYLSYRWLSRHVDLDGLSAHELADLLTLSTCEVEGVEPFAPHLSDVVVGYVENRDPHPDADKLGVCTVDVGAEDKLQIVCGAPNVAGGQKVAVATIGTVLPGDFKIKKSKIRGVTSMGMICSERELELGENHDGIWVLPEDLTIGAPVAESLGVVDWILEVDNKSLTHRPDLWGHRGIAREIAAITGREMKPMELLTEPFDSPGSGAPVPLSIESPSCSRYLGMPIDGVRIEESPTWLKLLLLAAGQRPIDLLVDLSNFVMLEIGQPNHTFDRGAVQQGIEVRQAKAGEKMTTLDGIERELVPGDMLICSGGEPVALAGVMGGEGSKVAPETSSLLLEVATFDPVTVRRTSNRLALRTDASARFEKHLDPTLPVQCAQRFAQLLRELQPEVSFPAPVSDVGEWTDPAHTLELRGARTRSALGADLSDEEQADILSRIGFGVSLEGGVIQVDVPSARATKDITIEQDLVEEVGRIHRYGNVPEAIMEAGIAPPTPDPRRRMVRDIQDRLAGPARCLEVMSYSFQGEDLHEKVGTSDQPYLEVTNPVAEGHGRIRRDVLPSVLGTLEVGRRHRDELRLFEVGKGYRPEESSDRGEPTELHQVAIVYASAPPAADASYDEGRLWKLRADVEDLLASLRLSKVEWSQEETAPSWAHPAKCLVGTVARTEVARLAELEPGVAAALGLEGELKSDVAACELSIDGLLSIQLEPPSYRPIPRFPAIKVDIAVLAPEDLAAGELAGAIETAGKGNVAGLELFDLYRGESLGEGKKSLAWHVELQSQTKTLTDKDAQKFLGRAERAVEKLGAEMRTG